MICSTSGIFDPPTHQNIRKAVYFCFKYYDAKGMKPPHKVKEDFQNFDNMKF